MSTHIRSHIRSNLVGYLALFLVISGGTAYATHPGGVNTISSTDILNGEVRNIDIRTGAVNDNKLAANSVTSQKVVADALTGDDIDESTLQNADAQHLVAPWQDDVHCNISRPVGQFCGYSAQGHWGNYGNGFQDARYSKDISGYVHIEGSVRAVDGAVSGLIFVLPSGYRPSATRLFTVYDEESTTKVGYVKVFPDGWVTYKDGDPTQTSYLQLDGIVFRP